MGQEMEGGMGTPMSPEQKQQLLDLKEKIESKKGEWDNANRMGDSQVEEAKAAALAEFFNEFQKAGIDPSDQDAMRDFFDKLYQQNPDLYEMIIPIIDQILGPGDAGQEQQPQMPEGEPQMGMPRGMPQGMMEGGGGGSQ